MTTFEAFCYGVVSGMILASVLMLLGMVKSFFPRRKKTVRRVRYPRKGRL